MSNTARGPGPGSGPVFLWREWPDGSRAVSNRAWVLIWVFPVLCAIAAAAMLVGQVVRHATSVPGSGEVVRVYEWEGETIFDRGVPLYGPVFRYNWNGEMTEATQGTSSPKFNFEIGSVHSIRYFPNEKRNIVYPGWHNWAPGVVILALAAATSLPAFGATVVLRRWVRAGT